MRSTATFQHSIGGSYLSRGKAEQLLDSETLLGLGVGGPVDRSSLETGHHAKHVTTQGAVFAARSYGMVPQEIDGLAGLAYTERALGAADIPLTHRVMRGDTLTSIAERYGVSVKSLAEANGITRPDYLEQGKTLLIPLTSVSVSKNSASSPGLIWPLSGPITSPFGIRWGKLHEGIDIGGVLGQNVVSPRDGVVVFSGWKAGYGITVVIEHEGNVRTVYAHLSRTLVSQGKRVVQGEIIGKVGTTGNSTGPHLHFELHVNNQPVNPLNWLP
ncbi:MAG: LysM peptidoglycan-binding domain-containing M23 family metallopeptidase [Bacillota bacterium]